MSRAIPWIEFTRQGSLLKEELLAAFREVLKEGQFILGPQVERFEKAFARFCQARHAVGVASGTDALELALRALGVGPGDEVITVSFTFISTASAICKVRARPIFVDVDPLTYTMDPHQVAWTLKRLPSARRKRIKVILPVHLYGHPCDMSEIGRLARREGWKVVEDAAQAHGAAWQGRGVGSLGDLACFSFYPTKNLGGYGDGGMVTTSSAALAAKLRVLRFQGRLQKDLQMAEGLNSRLDEIQAALLGVKLKHLTRWIERRRELASLYRKRLSGLPLQLPFEAPRARHVFHLFVIQAKERDALARFLLRRGIGTAIHYRIPVHLQPFYRPWGAGLRLPVTERLSRQILSLPLFPELKPTEVEKVCRSIRAFYLKPKSSRAIAAK